MECSVLLASWSLIPRSLQGWTRAFVGAIACTASTKPYEYATPYPLNRIHRISTRIMHKTYVPWQSFTVRQDFHKHT